MSRTGRVEFLYTRGYVLVKAYNFSSINSVSRFRSHLDPQW